MNAWFAHNSHSLRLALDRLLAAPLGSLISILVIGVAISLPTGLYILLANAQRAAGHIHGQPEITLFLKAEVERDAAVRIAQELSQRRDLDKARLIDKDQALNALRDSGLGDVTAGLEGNPLPYAIAVTPADADPAVLENLVKELAALPAADQVTSDTEWARRLAAILDFGRDLVWLLAGVLGLALAAITGNTIRLQIYAAREEIEVSRLIGATDRFVRRPFLYYGTLQALLGGIAAWAMVSGGLLLLDGSVARLTAAYGSGFRLAGLGWLEVAALLTIAALLGLAGAFVAVGHTLRQLD